MLNAMKCPNNLDDSTSSSCFLIDVCDEIINDSVKESNVDPLELSLLFEPGEEEKKQENVHEPVEAKPLSIDFVGKFESLGESGPNNVPSSEKPPPIELKHLPSHLKYAFLGVKNTLLVIISSSLSEDQEIELLRVLREHKTALGWTTTDIKGITPPFVCIKYLWRKTINQA